MSNFTNKKEKTVIRFLFLFINAQPLARSTKHEESSTLHKKISPCIARFHHEVISSVKNGFHYISSYEMLTHSPSNSPDPAGDIITIVIVQLVPE